MALINKGDVLTISAGHSTKTDPGAVGYRVESELNKLVTLAFVELCKKHNIIIYDVTPYDSDLSVVDRLAYEVNKANSYKSKLHICVHHNSSNGQAYGTEVYVYENSGFAAQCANAVVKAISNLGFKNRGVKENKQLYVIRETNMPCILTEIAFVDNINDMDLWKRLGEKNIAKAMFKALTGIEDEEKSGFLKNVVVYGNDIDKRAAEYLADYLKCPIVHISNFKNIQSERVYAIGGGLDIKDSIKIAGKDRYETIKAVLKYMDKL